MRKLIADEIADIGSSVGTKRSLIDFVHGAADGGAEASEIWNGGAHDQFDRPGRVHRKRREKLRNNFFAERAIFRVRDDADDLARDRFSLVLKDYTLTDRIALRKIFPREGFVHNYHRRRGLIVGAA